MIRREIDRLALAYLRLGSYYIVANRRTTTIIDQQAFVNKTAYSIVGKHQSISKKSHIEGIRLVRLILI